jgi:hypothetical protein
MNIPGLRPLKSATPFRARGGRLSRVLLAAVLLGSGGAAGCAMLTPMPGPPPYHVALSPGYNPAVQRRLLVMPLVGLEGDPVAATMITDALLNELRTVGPFEVVFAAPAPCPMCAPPRPLYPAEEELATLVEHHRPDAFVFVTVTTYSPYPPQELGLSLRVVGAYDRQTLASIDTVRYAAQDVPFSNGDCTFAHPADDLLIADAAVAASSPRQFAQLVAKHIAHALAMDPLPTRTTESGWSILPGPGRSLGWFGHSPRIRAAPR